MLARSLGSRIPIQPGKDIRSPCGDPRVPGEAPPLSRVRGRGHAVPIGLNRLGSTLEFAGYDSTLRRERLDLLRRAAAEYLLEPLGSRSRRSGSDGGR